ncbi:MAG: exodeoxyribonuclease VII small subunit [Deltaproteobacteria bacterium]|nr:MAG: exodeoxyribonuclease VII small subunit [Deltaproteobacteria bacterium]
MSEERDFESAMKRLEEIVQMLENGNLSLEESLKIFEEGMKLVKYCSSKLEEAERKVSILVQESNGKYVQVPFSEKEEIE